MKIHVNNCPEPTRLNKYLAQNSIVSRRKAEDLIGLGKIKIDGAVLHELGFKVCNGQIIEIEEESQPKSISIIINKPIGFVSAQAQKGERPAIILASPQNCLDNEKSDYSNLQLPALGRLDKDSRGLLIISNDGVLAKNVISPQSESEKEYEVKVRGQINDAKLAKLRFGLVLDGRKLRRAQVDLIGDHKLRFILKEGRNRQIRRMCQMLGLEVLDLLRVRIGDISLGDIPTGKWRHLNDREIKSFMPVPRLSE